MDFRVTHSHRVDLAPEAVGVLAEDVLPGDLALDLVQPGVEVVEVLAGLAELLLDGLLQGGRRGKRQLKTQKSKGELSHASLHLKRICFSLAALRSVSRFCGIVDNGYEDSCIVRTVVVFRQQIIGSRGIAIRDWSLAC